MSVSYNETQIIKSGSNEHFYTCELLTIFMSVRVIITAALTIVSTGRYVLLLMFIFLQCVPDNLGGTAAHVFPHDRK